MDPRYETYAMADPTWYEPLERCADAESALDLTHRGIPAGWVRREQGVWVMMKPGDCRPLPEQGWKIHITATAETLESTVEAAWEVCRERGLPWKFLRSRFVASALNSKYADRTASGKVVTVYPDSEAELHQALLDLDTALAGGPGPYVLSDLRWRQGPVSVRYGAFVPLWCELADGSRVPAMRDPGGDLVPDLRRPVFTVPEWVEVPEFLQSAEGEGGDALLGKYRVVKALHFSNAGGVYVAEAPDGTRVVLKEARPYAGLDGHGRDAVARLRHEHQVLSGLSGRGTAPKVVDYFTVWEHHYLALEYVQGETLTAWLGMNSPMTRHRPGSDTRDAFAERVQEVFAQVETALADLHAHGTTFGDLHPRNIMLQPDGSVRLIDFELAAPVDSVRKAALGAPGFVHRSITGAQDADRFALGCCRLSALFPLTTPAFRTPALLDGLISLAEDAFPSLPDSYFKDVRTRLRLAPGLREHVGAQRPLPEVDTSALARGVIASADTGREDRLYPADISVHRPGGGLGLAHGAPGVLLALRYAGSAVPEEHLDWLEHAVRRAPAETPQGLYDGLAGAGWALEQAGRPAAADVADRILDGPLPVSPSLYGGLTGIAHFLLQLGLKDEALRLAEQVADRVGTSGLLDRPGLMRGWSGPAVLFTRCAAVSGDTEWTGLAARCVQSDLRHGRDVDGMLQMHSGNRLLPYLSEGTAGVVLAALTLPEASEGRSLDGLFDAAARAAAVRGVLQGGLFSGRAGLIYLLAHLRNRPAGWRDEIDEQVRLTALHTAPHGDGLLLVGDQLLRLSSDLATGAAGALLALSAADGPGRHSLPGAHAEPA
jgi:serine/threonine protein kinase